MDEIYNSGNTPDPAEANAVSTPLLEFKRVVKSYGAKKVLKETSFIINRGGIIGLLGPNGSGKSTIIKLINGLLVPDSGEILVNGLPPSPSTASMVSYLPERNYLPLDRKVSQLIDYFADFYLDFDRVKAYEMLQRLNIDKTERMRALSKGTREKVQLILVMSRRAELYVLDEPIGGVDPAARDYILDTILSNYNENGSILISTHLINDIERALDDVIFISDGKAALCASADSLREKYNKSVDELFREVYKC
ncbi:MAG: ABC transporter ATP-binding protein [Clostridiales bacterium]|nr:ABC transporter ATP-binding protein [Clostridiales bacterium]